MGYKEYRDIIFFPIEVAIVEAYNVRLPLQDRKEVLGNRDVRNRVKGKEIGKMGKPVESKFE